MSHTSEDERQATERTMRRAESMGLDPQRVARALDHGAPGAPEYQAVAEVEPRSWFERAVSRRFARSS